MGFSEKQIRDAFDSLGWEGYADLIKTLKASRAKPSDGYTILTNTGNTNFPNAIIGPTFDIKDDLKLIKDTSGGIQYVSNVTTLLPEKKTHGPGWKFTDKVMGAVREVIEDKPHRIVDASRVSERPEVNEYGNFCTDGYVFYGVNQPEGKVYYVVGIQDYSSEESRLDSVLPLNAKAVLECQEKGWLVMTKKALATVKSAEFKGALQRLYNARQPSV